MPHNMKFTILAAIFAAVASSPVVEENQWPWQVGKVYNYDVSSHTLTSFEQGSSNGNGFKAQFIISVKAPGHLLAKLEHSQYAPVKAQLTSKWEPPSDLKYEPFPDLDQTFEIFVAGGRVVSVNFPSNLTVALENVVKGLIGTLQVDLSNTYNVHSYPNSYDKHAFQGIFKKMEADVSGDCETLYSISPMSSEWRREAPMFSSEEDPIEIVKSRDYGNCQKRLGTATGVPEGAVWAGLASSNEERQFITHNSETRLLAGKNGTIYKSQTMGFVYASPIIYGKQKAEVYTHTKFLLNSVTEDNTIWQMSKEFRSVNSLLYTEDPSMSFYIPGDKQHLAKAQQILQEISPLLQNPNNMPEDQFLIKFNLLVYVLSALNPEQLTHLTTSLEVAKTSENLVKNNMWIIYRDAVALAGTPEAFQEIKSWVLTKKVEGEEAAQLITTIGISFPKPSKALIEEFFHFAICEEVTQAEFVNNSALLASTKLLRLAADDKFTVETVIPYLSKELKQAVETGATSKAMVYVVVLGNLAHPAILNVFAPYFEGQIPVTKYLRTQMVTNLRKLANRKDAYVRSVLYSIIRNTAEPYEVRVAAALNIFMAFPTLDMMRVLTHMAKLDPSTQVRAVLTNGITYAAGLKDPQFTILAKTAQSVLNLISKEKYGYMYSSDSLKDSYSSDDEFSYFIEQSCIGSDDDVLPKYQRRALRFMGTGLTEESQVTLSLSSVPDVAEYINSLLNPGMEIRKTNLKFTVKRIIELLNIKRKSREPIEFSVLIEILNQQKLFTFNQEDIKRIVNKELRPSHFGPYGSRGNIPIRYTKVLYNRQISIAFPLVNGMPFRFEYREPLLLNLQAKINLMDPIFDIDALLARNIDGSIVYMDTLGKTFAAAGIVNQLQIHLPLKLTIDSKPKFRWEFPGKDVNLVHLSVLPYTGTQKQNAIEYELEVFERPVKTLSTDLKFGHWAGVIYQLQASSYSADYKNWEELFKDDILTTIGNLLYQKDVALTQFNFKYLGSESQVNSIAFIINAGSMYIKESSGEMDSATTPVYEEPHSLARHKELIKKVSAGIAYARADLVDFTVELNGTKPKEYVFTTAYVYSYFDRKFQAGFLSHGNNQLSAFFKYDASKAKIVPLNLEDALKNEIKVTFEADVNYQKTNINLQGYGVRTKEYTEQLKNDPRAKHCLQDITEQNYYQLDCHKMIVKAHAPDYFKATVTYKDLDPELLVPKYVYKVAKEAFSWDEEVNLLETTADDKLEIEAQALYHENYINYKLSNKYGTIKLDKAEGIWNHEMPFYDVFTNWERAKNYSIGYQDLPYCAVDGSKVWTFSGRSYDYALSGSWHVVMVDDRSNGPNLVILARRPSAHQTEVYISYETKNGKYVEIEIKPSNVSISGNSQNNYGGITTPYLSWNTALLEHYYLAEGVQAFDFDRGYLRAVYDTHRLVIFTDKHRGTTRGICGQNSGQTQDDYMTPWGLVDRPDHYGASFSLDEECDDRTLALKKEAKLKAYQPVTKFTKIPRYDADWYKTVNKST